MEQRRRSIFVLYNIPVQVTKTTLIVMSHFSEDFHILFQSIVKQLLGVIKAVAGNDNVKVAIAKENGFELILGAMSKHMSQEKVCELGCAAIATIILRQPKHCQRVMDANGAAVIIQAMNVHKNSDGVQVS